jgi:hypothetical protein
MFWQLMLRSNLKKLAKARVLGSLTTEREEKWATIAFAILQRCPLDVHKENAVRPE